MSFEPIDKRKIFKGIKTRKKTMKPAQPSAEVEAQRRRYQKQLKQIPGVVECVAAEVLRIRVRVNTPELRSEIRAVLGSTPFEIETLITKQFA